MANTAILYDESPLSSSATMLLWVSSEIVLHCEDYVKGIAKSSNNFLLCKQQTCKQHIFGIFSRV